MLLHGESEEFGLVSPKDGPGSQGGVMVIVDDVDALYERCKEAGAPIDSEMTEPPYGIRLFATHDPESHAWYFGSLTEG